MTRIAIIESNPPELISRQISSGVVLWSQHYAATIRHFAPLAELRVVQPYAGEGLDPAAFDGIVFTGSSVDWQVAAVEAKPLRVAMERCLAAGRPILGSCNGMQLAAEVLGGSGEASPNGTEIGIAAEIALTEAGRSHPMMAGREARYAVPCIHRDKVNALPEGAVLLSGNSHSSVQAFAYAKGDVEFWGVQYHPEISFAGMSRHLIGMKSASEVPEGMVADLARCEADGNAAAQLGLSESDLPVEKRACEIRNWLDYLSSRIDT